MRQATMGLAMGLTLLGCEDLPGSGEAGEVLFEDDFDVENGGEGELNYERFEAWDVVEGSVDLIGNGLYDFVPDNGLYVDLDGTTGEAGTLVTATAFDLQPGEYRLTFEVAGPQLGGGDTLSVQVGDVFAEDIDLAGGEAMALFERDFTVDVATTAPLTFAASGGDNEGILLFTVRLARGG